MRRIITRKKTRKCVRKVELFNVDIFVTIFKKIDYETR